MTKSTIETMTTPAGTTGLAVEPESRGLVKCDIENLGKEVWLVDNPIATQEAFDEFDGPDDDCALDAAARVSRNAVTLRAHWGNDIPSERDEHFLADCLDGNEDADETRELIEQWWAIE